MELGLLDMLMKARVWVCGQLEQSEELSTYPQPLLPLLPGNIII